MNMLDAVEYIQEHYRDEDICVEQVAERFHMSVSYFSKLFNEYAGMTFPEFITDLRLTYAKEMLRANPDINIKRWQRSVVFPLPLTFLRSLKRNSDSLHLPFGTADNTKLNGKYKIDTLLFGFSTQS